MQDRSQQMAREYLLEVLRQTGLTPTELARRCKLAPSTFNRFLNDKQVKHTLSSRTLQKVQDATGIKLPSRLTKPLFAQPQSPLSSLQGSAFFPERVTADLPVLGHVKAGLDAVFIENGVVQAYVERPSFLFGDPTSYAVYAHDDCMEPAILHGNLLYVTPSRPALPGDDVVIQMSDNQAHVKRLVRRAAGDVICKQFNPPQEVRFKANQVRSIHLVAAILKLRT